MSKLNNKILEVLDSYKYRVSFEELTNIPVICEFLEGRNITVKRSNGIIDYDWKISKKNYSYFVWRVDMNSWVFEVEKSDLTKIFRVEHLKMSIRPGEDERIIDIFIDILNKFKCMYS